MKLTFTESMENFMRWLGKHPHCHICLRPLGPHLSDCKADECCWKPLWLQLREAVK